MKTWLIHHLRALQVAWRRLLGNFTVTLISVLVIGVSLSLPAGLYQIVKSVRIASGKLASQPEVSVFMTLDASDAQAKALEAALAAHSDVSGVRFVSRERALVELKRTTGDADVLDSLENNPLPHAFVVRAKQQAPQALERLKKTLAELPNVADVRFDSEWARTLAGLLSFAQRLALLLGIALGLGLVMIVANTIRAQVLDARDEIEVAQSIGASDGFVRRPFLYFGALQGALGAAAALVMIALAANFLNRESLLNFQALDLRVGAPSGAEAGTLLILAALLGWLGALISVRRYLKGAVR